MTGKSQTGDENKFNHGLSIWPLKNKLFTYEIRIEIEGGNEQ